MKFQAPIIDLKAVNRYCEPSVISALTGMTTSEAARLVRVTATGRYKPKMIKGTFSTQMQRALGACGINMHVVKVYTEQRHDPRTGKTVLVAPSFSKWLKQSAQLRKAREIFLVIAGNHWQLVSGRWYVCGITGEVVGFDHPKVKRRAKVTKVFHLVEKYQTIVPDIARKPIVKAEPNKARAALAKLERAHGFKIRIVSDGSFKDAVSNPTPFWPEGFQTFHYDWYETLDCIERCIKDQSLVEEGVFSE